MKLRQTEPTIETVGECKFYITPFPAFKAANLSGELASVLAPLFGALIPLVEKGNGEDGEKFDLGDIDAVAAAEAMSGCAGLNGDKLEQLMKKLLLGGHIVAEFENEDGETEQERLDMDLANEIFCGEIQDMFILCFHVIKMNFNGFFKRIAGQSGKAKSAGKKTPRKVL